MEHEQDAGEKPPEPLQWVECRDGWQRRARVLLAEDDVEMRIMLASALKSRGYTVLEAPDGDELLDYVGLLMVLSPDEDPVDVIIADIRMPGLATLDALAEAYDSGWKTPLIVITAFGGADVRAQAERLGAVAVLDKPFDVDALCSLVRDHTPARPAERPPADALRPTRILLAEDDNEMRGMLASDLRSDGYHVIEVPDGPAVLGYIGKGWLTSCLGKYVDVIVSDIRMPGMSGIDILAGMRSAGWRLPFILITAFGGKDLHDRAKWLGASAVFDKPFDIDELRSVLRDITRRPTE